MHKVAVIADSAYEIQFHDTDLDAVDVILLLGDLSNSSIERLFNKYGLTKTIVGIRGNHDSLGVLEEQLLSLHRQRVQLTASLTITGANGIFDPRYPKTATFSFQNCYSSADYEDFRGLLVPGAQLVITHASPFSPVGRDDGIHSGIPAFRAYLEAERPLLWFHGHLHESAVTRYLETEIYAVYGILFGELTADGRFIPTKWTTPPKTVPIYAADQLPGPDVEVSASVFDRLWNALRAFWN